MNLIIDRSSLLKALGHVHSVVERRTTIPILSNVRLDAKEDNLFLNATDMDLEIVESAPAKIISEGAMTTPAHTLYDIVRKLPDGSQIEFVYLDNNLTLTSGRSRFQLSCLPPEDFPLLAPGDFLNTFSLNAGDLRTLIDRTRFAISTEETRYYLNGIYLHANTDGRVNVLTSVATDGHRLALSEMALPEGASGMPGIIIPRKAVLELRKLIDLEDKEVNVSLSESKIRFSLDKTLLTSKLIDGSFPDYSRVIPENNDKVLEVNTKSFSEAVDRVSAISAEKSRSIKLNLEKGLVTLSASSPESGSASEEIEAKYDSSQLEIGFNSRYLLDIAQQIDGDAIRFTMEGPDSPTIVQDSSDGSSTFVLMPMRV